VAPDIEVDRPLIGANAIPVSPSLVPLWQEVAIDAPWAEPLFSAGILNGEPRGAVVFDRMKYVRFERSGRERLYDLAADPEEKIDLVCASPAVRESGARLLGSHRRQSEVLRRSLGGDEEESALDAETLKKLRALGYLE
jgi:hypothetical protein